MTPANLIMTVATVATLGIVSLNGVNIVRKDKSPQPPIIVTDAKVLNRGGVVKKDGILRYQLTVHKRKDCAASYDLLFHSPETGDLKAAAIDKDGGKVTVNEGPTPRVFSVVLPPKVMPGEWTYRIIGRCQLPGEPWEWPIPHPPMKITVIDG